MSYTDEEYRNLEDFHESTANEYDELLSELGVECIGKVSFRGEAAFERIINGCYCIVDSFRVQDELNRISEEYPGASIDDTVRLIGDRLYDITKSELFQSEEKQKKYNDDKEEERLYLLKDYYFSMLLTMASKYSHAANPKETEKSWDVVGRRFGFDHNHSQCLRQYCYMPEFPNYESDIDEDDEKEIDNYYLDNYYDEKFKKWKEEFEEYYFKHNSCRVGDCKRGEDARCKQLHEKFDLDDFYYEK